METNLPRERRGDAGEDAYAAGGGGATVGSMSGSTGGGRRGMDTEEDGDPVEVDVIKGGERGR
jgi:hypothetical protein